MVDSFIVVILKPISIEIISGVWLGWHAALKSPTLRRLLQLPSLAAAAPISTGAVHPQIFTSKSPFRSKLDATAPFKQHQQQQQKQQQRKQPTPVQKPGSQRPSPAAATKQVPRRHVQPTFSSTEPDPSTYDVQPMPAKPGRKGRKGSRPHRK